MLALGATSSAAAEDRLALQGRNYACEDPQKMNLWDLSASSPLIRHDMLRKDWCWKTPSGLQVRLVEKLGKFVRLQHLNNQVIFYAYASDVRKPAAEAPERPAPQVKQAKVANVTSVQFTHVRNTDPKYGVEMKKAGPAVHVGFKAAPALNVEFNIAKSQLRQGYSERITKQNGPNLSVGGSCDGNEFLPLKDDEGDWFAVTIMTLDPEKKRAEFEVSGAWHECASSKRTYNVAPSRFVVSGKAFDELMRPHTSQEMKKTF